MNITVDQQISADIQIDFEPSESQLERLAPLLNAIDALITYNCFVDSNPMRIKPEDVLFWDWTIVTVNGFSIPVPIHTCSEMESALYSFTGDEIIMSNAECARTTAFFYMDHLLRYAQKWEQVQDILPPFFCTMLRTGILAIKGIHQNELVNIMSTLKRGLTENGIKILE